MENVKENVTIIENIGKILLDVERPLKERFRALFTLRNIGGELAIRCIEKCFSDSSALLKHECAYCLGQMQDPQAVPKLESVLEDLSEEPIVRHEAAEALAAIGQNASLPLLRKYINDPCVEVSETCQLAVRKMEESDTEVSTRSKNPFQSVDPALPLPKASYDSIDQLEKILLDDSQPLYGRYQAMFSLRNINSKESAVALAKGLSCGSALFKHEVAYVLGQMQNDATVKQLAEVLFDETQHEMVRHECAEALGAIATEECMNILNCYLKDEKRVVRESCEVALDMCDYENSKEFQYADSLIKAMS
ncbi:deoxyhypusine hydroxylase-like [Argiope bruennichi]|uniref:deoxyhypusine hydroxylase-like n=1 Tax=Argiope bruennichi TaxID=94029 RepID=UPI0024951BC5|nr:deoxyhypusine hydroxylase-like [Argiope bruennichi]